MDPPLFHRLVRLAIKNNNMWRKSGFRVSKNLFVIRDGFVWSLHLLFILIFKMKKLSKNKNLLMTLVKKKRSAKLDF